MKIIQIFPGKVWGGAEQFIIDLSMALQEMGHQVLFFAHDCPAINNRLQGTIPYTTLPFRFSLDLSSAKALARVIRAEHPDIIHVHDSKFVPLVSLAKRMSGCEVKLVFTRHIARGSKVNPFFRKAFKNLHNVIFVSELGKKMWHEANPWMPEEKCKVVHNSIPPMVEAECETLREKYNVPADTPIVAFAGRVRRSKGCEIIVRALGELRNLPFQMVFIGTCKPKDYDQTVLQLADECGIKDRIHFYGFSDRARLLIKNAEIGVAPSIVREALGLSPMEFMQAGRCVITTNNGAQPEYIRDGETGLLVSPRSVEELTAALKKVLEDTDYRDRIGANAKRYFDDHLSYDKFMAKILKCYE